MKYVFPAVFTERDARFIIEFPDLDGCHTSAETIAEGVEMAMDVLNLFLCVMEDDSRSIPSASDIRSISVNENSFATLVFSDTEEYRNRFKDDPNWRS